MRKLDAGGRPHFDAIWILPAFNRSLDALCRGEPNVRAKVRKVLDRYLSDSLGLHRSPLHGSRRRVFHTRVDGERRLIDEPLDPARPSEVAALYVGHHDANEWGARYDDDTLSKLSSAQRLSASDSNASATPALAASMARTRTIAGVHEEAPPAYDEVRSSGVGDRQTFGHVLTLHEIEARGVPPELARVVFSSSDSIDLASIGLSDDVASKVENWYLSKLPAKRVAVPVPAIDEPKPIRVTRSELTGILRLPLNKLLATMSDDQRRMATRESERLYVVRGAAGSGKTIVGVRRIEYWVRQRDLFDARPILFTCYNKVLAHAAAQMIEDALGQTLAEANVHVTTAFKLMSRVQRELEGRRFARLVPKSQLLPVIAQARVAIPEGAAVGRWSDEQLLDEILEVIFARVITSKTQYLEADRSGRGTARRLDAKSREIIWRVLREFRRICDAMNVAPWDQLPARVVGLLERRPVTSPRYAAIVIDEAQDLAPSVIRALLALQGGEDRNMLILGDAAQNVYRNSFRWAHTGLKVAGGQVATLRRCYRSTPTIVQAASPLIARQSGRFEEDLTLPEPNGEPGPAVAVKLYASPEAELQAVAEDIAIHIESGVPPSSIGVLLDDARARRRLRDLLTLLDCHVEEFQKPNGEKFIDIFDPSVKLLTAASAKGIEFQVLFVPSVTEPQYPSSDSDGESADRARRVLYTAMTRCAYELQLSSPAGVKSNLLSELDQSCVITQSVARMWPEQRGGRTN
jgi:superfamily I DNA/RNA helicase